MTKTLVLTSKKNFSWQSMQEIIPFLVETWNETSNKDTVVVDVDETPIRGYLNHLIAAENIVLTCFTPALYKVAQFARFEVNMSARFFVHLHNHATIGCWPLRHWGAKDFFRKSDIFISSCTRDAVALTKTYPDAKIQVVPFSYKQLPDRIIDLKKSDVIPFVFIGRISSQKNLHTLILSFYHFQKQNSQIKWTFEVFGKEDGLGSPNMGFEDSGYLVKLKNLASQLGIDSKITFHGFQDRKTIQDYLEKNKVIFTAPSLHSDENFGMAAFQSLINGHLAVLSDWGGHADFKTHFPKQTYLTPVMKSARGPFINPLALAKNLANAASHYTSSAEAKMPEHYQFENIKKLNANILKTPADSLVNLTVTEAADIILNRVQKQISVTPGKQDQKIFDSYQDPLAHVFLEAYGMENQNSGNGTGEFSVPWMKIATEKIIIEDPHRGHFELKENLEAQTELFGSGYRY